MRKKSKENEKKGFIRNNKKRLIIAVATLVILGIGGGAYVSSVEGNLESWKEKIYPGVKVKGVDLSGKTAKEAKDLLNESLVNKINDKDILIKVGDKEYKAKYNEVGGAYDIDKAVIDAINYEKDGNIFKQNSIIQGKEKDLDEVEVNFLYDDKKLEEFKKKVVSKVNIKPKDATIRIDGNNKQITDEVIGKKLDKKILDENLRAHLNGDLNEGTVLNLEYIEDKPKKTREELSKIKDIMGSFESSFSTSTVARSANIAAAVSFVDGTVLMPGEEFSYDKATSTDKSKYHQAPVYINNKIEMDIGGGICQVSSALYRANMEANVRATERHNHSLTVSYSKPSLDATVAWGYLDYRFKNPYDFPIYIKGTSDGKVIRFYIYGDKSGMKGRTYEMQNEIVKTIPPNEKIVNDPNLEEGKRVVESTGQAGYVSKGYQLTYENGKLISKELISTDTYATTDTVIKVGTKKVEAKKEEKKIENKPIETPVEQPVEQPTEQPVETPVG
ncbi:VanW family protein [uncultured Clostridium sp.]|uniref:VanW family protein n=1 Tax=uncultured Clostridium sp. TaxID=59620 RepID=UPI002632E7F0|nr:VanW family protein [uncultured Clostridium sp.]